MAAEGRKEREAQAGDGAAAAATDALRSNERETLTDLIDRLDRSSFLRGLRQRAAKLGGEDG